MRKKINKKTKVVTSIVFLGICFSIFLIRILTIESRFDNIHCSFSSISKIDSLNNYVIKKHVFKGFKYTPTMVFITLDNNKEYKISAQLNSDYSNQGINDILENGDKLVKNSKNDSLYIEKRDYDKTRYYLFLLKSLDN